ncbi:MAG TPA: basic secretory protein-like protein [Gemmataceae bacterium]|nr:basic secretory protein-like protein [Gemmataceae bacterium]
MRVAPYRPLLIALVFCTAQAAWAAEKPKPVEVTVDVSEVPDLKEWGEKAKELVVKWHPKIADMLKSDGFTPPSAVKVVFKKDMDGVAYTSGKTITISAAWVKKHPDDYGMVVHELTHVVQSYRRAGRGNGWLVEGIADYVRFFQYEPGKLGTINARRARYDGSYRVTAAFLAYVTEKHDKDIVGKLNAALREGTYKDELFKERTGKTVKELDEEWRASLKK